ncbi:MAG: GreA/GreB family elongation factor [Syntrophaceae bacterium]|nr:GreA/GreB family elongation factor [Syntrophaceae bacterium]HOC60763.1 GreA/GreB family elongation factor [Smithellaceae bacterium]HQM46283.1 GreA/GreB family elongation factor [Smithellaceae bacterium]
MKQKSLSNPKRLMERVFFGLLNIFDKDKVTILAPMGIALLGYRKGDMIEWKVPSDVKKIRGDEIIYQPEASGDYHL